MMDLIWWQPVIAVLSAAITESFKRAFLPTRWCGLVCFGIGLSFGVLVGILDAETPLLHAILGGLMGGLAGSGAYSSTKALTGK